MAIPRHPPLASWFILRASPGQPFHSDQECRRRHDRSMKVRGESRGGGTDRLGELRLRQSRGSPCPFDAAFHFLTFRCPRPVPSRLEGATKQGTRPVRFVQIERRLDVPRNGAPRFDLNGSKESTPMR